jgi:hypothetical protein
MTQEELDTLFFPIKVSLNAMVGYSKELAKIYGQSMRQEYWDSLIISYWPW